MSISAKQVMDLRAATGMPMMKCKQALEAEGGDYEKAVERLRKEGLKAADKRAGRATGDGLVRARISPARDAGVLVAVGCETEPVSRTPLFTEFVDRLVDHVEAKRPRGVDDLLRQPWIDDGTQTVEEVRRGLIARIGENIQVLSADLLQLTCPGLVGAYVHFDHKQGAIVALGAKTVTPGLADLAKEVCMHVVFKRPQALTREEIPASVAAKEAEIARAQVTQDPKMAKKPPQVVEKIVQGKLAAFYQDAVLVEQAWFKPEVEASVAHVLAPQGATVTAFRHASVGG